MLRRLALALPLAFAAAALADETPPAPKVGEPTKVTDGKDPIDVPIGHATPFVADWDGDGKRDLLVGQFDGGKLRIYTNKGKDDAPSFDGFTFLQAGGADATVPYG